MVCPLRAHNRYIGIRRLDPFAVLRDTLVKRPESVSESVLVTGPHILVVYHSGFGPASPHHDSSAHRLDAVHSAHARSQHPHAHAYRAKPDHHNRTLAAALPAQLRFWRRHAHDDHHYDPDHHNRTLAAALPARLRSGVGTPTTTTTTITTTTATTETPTSTTSTTGTAPDPCKNGAWMKLGYANQGECESAQHH